MSMRPWHFVVARSRERPPVDEHDAIDAALALLWEDKPHLAQRVLGEDRPAVPSPQRPGAPEARGLRERMERAGARLVGIPAEPLPSRLRDLGDANPAPLFMSDAEREAFEGVAVTVVGTRRATAAGLEIAYNLGACLASAGVVVVSGLARGIDAAVHKGVVAEGGRGLAVLGSGIDVVYPARHRQLAADLREAGGGLVSQFAPGAQPLPWRFPVRNRLLAALGDVVVIVESHSEGGALITAQAALELGRDVMAVPGSPLVSASAGCNQLLRDGAGVVSEFDDVLAGLGLKSLQAPPLWTESVSDAPSRRVLDLLTAEPVAVEVLVRLARLSASDVSRALARLELLGLVARERGGVRRRAPPRPSSEQSGVGAAVDGDGSTGDEARVL
jgi:DNA processing protein